MTIHLIKLSVGSESAADIAAWQKKRLADMKARGQKPELIHVTRQMPKRAAEVLDGGSIYWVTKGWICARQKLIELRPMVKNGIPHCGLVLDRKLITVQPLPRRAFQGWRYFDPADAPPDLDRQNAKGDAPEEMLRELRALGLI